MIGTVNEHKRGRFLYVEGKNSKLFQLMINYLYGIRLLFRLIIMYKILSVLLIKDMVDMRMLL